MYNILVCDDEKDIVSALKIYLTSDGYRVYEAYDGQEAVDIIRNEDIQLVLMDVMMPKMDGIQAMVKIREISNVPVILLTAKIIDEMLRFIQSIFRQIRAVDDLKALGRWVKLGDKTVRNGVAVLVLIQNNTHRHTVVVFLLDVLLKLIRTGVLDAFTDLAVRAEIVDPADRFGLDGCFLRGGNHGAGNAFTVLQSVDRYIVPSVGQHC